MTSPGGADRSRPDADLDDVGAGDDERFRHVAGDDVAGHDAGLGMVVADALDDVEELLRISVGDVEADEPDRRALGDRGELAHILSRGAERVEGVAAVRPGEEGSKLRLGVVLVQRRQRTMFSKRAGHRRGPGHVHVGGDEGKTFPLPPRVEEPERPVDVDGAAGREGRALGPDKNVLEIELDVGFDTHERSRVDDGGRRLFVIDISWAPGIAYRGDRGGGVRKMSDKLIFYTHPMSRARIVRWMLEEVGEPYETKILEFNHSMKGPDYLVINPMGKVPAIRHGDTVVTETAAICAYLADAFPAAGLAPPPGSHERGPYYRWLFFAAGPIEAAVTDKALGCDVPAEREGMVGYGNMDRALAAVEGQLYRTDYIAGDKFTAADVYLGSAVGWGMLYKGIDKRPAFERYWALISARPAFIRAKAIDDALIEERKKAS